MPAETNPAAFDTATSSRLGRETAQSLHSSEFGFVLGPLFRSEAHALASGRIELANTSGYGRGGFDSGAFLDSFRAALAALGGWDTAKPCV